MYTTVDLKVQTSLIGNSNPIGGYFGLELEKGRDSFHSTPYILKSGRSSLHFILKQTNPKAVYIPFFSCDVILEPFEMTGTQYIYYEINDTFEPLKLPDLGPDEYFLYINYFDIKRNTVYRLSEKYRDKLIVDCTQAFFMRGNGISWFFNSCRKFFGVPDGSFLYVPDQLKPQLNSSPNENYLVNHLLNRFNGYTREGYMDFIKNEILCGGEITGISKLSEFLLSNVNYEWVIRKRIENFNYLDSIYKNDNFLKSFIDGVPMTYTLLLNKSIERKKLNDKNVFIPTYWPEVLNRPHPGFTTERFIAKRLLPLPIDHRYNLNDMKNMAAVINKLI